MNRGEADLLASSVRRAVEHDVEVLADGEFFVVQVAHRTERGSDTYTLYDEADWGWLRPRITC
jgi:hypothetical protein